MMRWGSLPQWSSFPLPAQRSWQAIRITRYDEVLGVYYAQARFYDPTEQRFLARDSHWDAYNRVYGDAGNTLADNAPSIAAIRQSANLYTYAINNPLLYTDPLGRFTSMEDYEYQVQQQRSFGYRTPNPNGQATVGAGRGGYYTTFGCAPKSNGILDYLGRSVDQVIRGNYSENVTLLGTVGQVAIGFTGLDFVADIRDVTYDITHWENTPEHFGQTALDVLGLLPIVGGLIKGGDEVVTLVKSAAKLENVNVVDNFVETTEIIDGLGDAAKGAGKGKIPWDSWQNYEKVNVNGREYAKVGDRLYSKHAVDRMQPSGNRFGSNIEQAGGDYGRSIAPQYVDDIVSSTKPVFQPETGNYVHTSGSVKVIVNPEGTIVTIMTYQ